MVVIEIERKVHLCKAIFQTGIEIGIQSRKWLSTWQNLQNNKLGINQSGSFSWWCLLFCSLVSLHAFTVPVKSLSKLLTGTVNKNEEKN